MLIENVTIKKNITQLDPLPGPALALFLQEYAQQYPNHPKLIICQQATQAQALYDELCFFTNNQHEQQQHIYLFPDWEVLPYDTFSPYEDISAKRLELLAKLPIMSDGFIIVTASNLMQKVPPKSYIQHHSFILSVNDILDLKKISQQLEYLGYYAVSSVMQHGEFAIRGSVFDIFPSGSDLPYRIDLFDNEVESIRRFDPETQLSIDKINKIELIPAKELPLNSESVDYFSTNWQKQFGSKNLDNNLYKTIVKTQSNFSGIEFYAPLFFSETMALILDYLPESSEVVTIGNLSDTFDTTWQEINDRYEQRRHDIERPLLTPDQLWSRPDKLFSQINQFKQLKIHATKQYELFDIKPLSSDIAVNYRHKQVLTNLIQFQQQQQCHVIICAESIGRQEIIKSLFDKNKININTNINKQNQWPPAILTEQANFTLMVGTLWSSIYLTNNKLALISENDLLGHKVTQQARSSKKTQKNIANPDQSNQLIKNLIELTPGDPVVHIEHGIGKYLGLEVIDLGNQSNEFVTIAYAKGDKLYLPVTSINLLSRYSANSSLPVPMNTLGNEQWDKAKRKALEKAYDIAAELLSIYAERAAYVGDSLSCADEDYQRFASEFPFEETPDQAQAIDAVVCDLAKTKPMDRVICGDVGFGKTEVAMRAAFICAMAQHQTAILVPTTLLAEQHGENFTDRFAQWPIKIAVLSRFKTNKQQQAILAELANGSVDIVIGTHKLLQQTINFAQLGLIIIDEEHRFGVRQKEKLKQMKAKVNSLAMTATPIPRTLNMAMAALRDFSIIASPPAKRLAVKTFVSERNKANIIEAIIRELHRGGQVFFLHNNVQTIHRCAAELTDWLPERASVRVAHGQMPERELEGIMAEFYHQRFNLLVCTTIIETGIDIPSANTIIIDRADKLGLAQLHQLRGRVGRSHHQAYAYLLHPGKKIITKDALKRLSAIESLGDLGAGFALASHDLEIRGAGELLGEEQSGQMHAIGFTLYLELIEQAVKDLKAGKTKQVTMQLRQTSEIDLGLPALIPDNYINDVNERLKFYQRIAQSETNTELEQIQIELIDRFGLLPDATKHLFTAAELKQVVKPLDIKKLTANSRFIKCDFYDNHGIDPNKLIKLLQNYPKSIQLTEAQQLKLNLTDHTADQRVNLIWDKVNLLLKFLIEQE